MMASILTNEGEEYMLETAFSEEQSAPANFYIGLCHDTPALADGLGDIANEPSGSGYARIAVDSASAQITVSLVASHMRARFSTVQFAASGGAWGSVNHAFVATTADSTGKYIGAYSLTAERTLQDGETLNVTLTLTQTTSQ